MGATSSVVDTTPTHMEHEKYFEQLMQSGLNISEAYRSFKGRYNNLFSDASIRVQGQDENDPDPEAKSVTIHKSIHMLAIRQLSSNLSNYKQADNESSFRQRQEKLNHIPSNRGEFSSSRLFNGIAASGRRSPENNGGVDYDDFSLTMTGDNESKRPPPRLAKKPTLSINISAELEIHPKEHSNGGSGCFNIDQKGILSRVSSDQVQISPRGTFHIGQWRIRENGLSSQVGEAGAAEGEEEVTSLRDSGRAQFLEIGSLGSGASGSVVEALHVPTLTIVALKMLPVHNNEKRLQLSSELQILYQNLASLRLVDQSLRMEAGFDSSEKIIENVDGDDDGDSAKRGKSCPHVLSFYNAFADPRSGMVNLVIEYMDGGSLQDLVNRGGCSDEDILADIAYQTLKGLKYLHDNNNVHRDIKPANILTSSRGVVKIADFGISKAVDGSAGYANSFVGTVCYMSPFVSI